jgi:PAS domain S-box-containing protein
MNGKKTTRKPAAPGSRAQQAKGKERPDDPRGQEQLSRDNEALRRRIDALELEAQRFKATLYSIGDAVIATNMDGIIVQMNHMAEELTGWPEAEALGRPAVEVFRIVNEETGVEVENPVMHVLRKGIVVGIDNHTLLIARNGSKRPIADSDAPIHDAAGSVIGVVLVFRDQTRERAAQQALEESYVRKRMEESLATERRFLRQVIDTVPAFICVKTAAGPYALANESLAKAYGTTVSSVEGKSDLDFSPTPEEAAAFRKDDLEVINGRRTKTIAEEPITYADGTVHWYSTTKIPIIDPDGSCSKVLVVAMDITELREHRKHLQELVERQTVELTASQAALVEAQAVARMGSWEWDAVKDGITASKEFYRLFDIAPEQIARFAQFVEQLHPGDRERVQQEVAAALKQNRPYDTDYRVKLHDGGWRDINARGRVITDTDGKPLRMVGTCMDITERKRDEEALKTSRERLLFATEGADLGIWNWNTVSGELIWSDKCKALFGIPADETMSYQRFSDALHPDDRERTDHAVNEALDKHKDYNIEYRSLWPDGSIHWLAAKGRGYYDATGKAVRLEGVVLDISERKQTERQFKALNESLARSNQELEQFAYVASHDLQEPLRMVSSYTQLLAQRYQDKLDQDAKDFIGYAVDGANRMQRLIQDLLEYSRITTRGQPPAPLDIHDALGEAVRNLQAAIQESGAMVTTDELPLVRGDHTQIVQVLQNLIGNGIKFHRTDLPPRVHLSAERSSEQPDFWTFKVADNGIGIEPRHFERLFVIFQRLHGKQEYSGNGIGLALCKRIVERHGGRIWVESQPGKGSTFQFTLPGKNQHYKGEQQ